MKRTLYRITAVLTALAFLITVQAAYEARIPKNVAYAAVITLQPGESTQESTVTTEGTESTEENETSEESEASESTENIEVTESGEPTEGTEETENSEVTESTEETEGDESTEGTEETEGSESIEGTEETEGSESTESTEETEASEPTESTEETEASEPTEATEETEGDEPTEAIEETSSSEPTESSEETGNSEVTESSAPVEHPESVTPQPPQETPNTDQNSKAEEGNQEEENPWLDAFNSADQVKQPSNEHLYQVVQNYTPAQPPAAIQDNFQDEFNKGLLDISKGIYDEVLDDYKGDVLEAIQDTAKEMSKDYRNQAYIDRQKGGALLQEAVSDRNSYKYFLDDDFMDATHQKYNGAMDLLDSGTVKSFKGDVAHLVDVGLEVYNVVGDCIGLAGDVVTIVDDVKELGNLKHEHSSWKAVEATLLVTDIGLTAVGIGATLGLVTLGPAVGAALMVGGVVVGISSAFVHSDAFANYMNSTDGSLQSFLEGLFPWMKTPDGVNCYKPNIYIYDKDGRRIQVIFTEPELILISIPEYEAGWTVDASADGTLLTEAGEEYDFLFYESMTVKGMFDTQSGFRIDAGDRSSQWESILAEYGFNEEEIADFVEFWDVKLDADKDYIMYPQYTETVDEAMPIVVAPVPENMVRIWFVFEEYTGQEYEEEQIVPFSREGYTVVEWGGMIF